MMSITHPRMKSVDKDGRLLSKTKPKIGIVLSWKEYVTKLI